MELSTSFYLVTACAVVITGISKSGFGGGLGVMSVPLMSLYITPQLAVAILMPVLLAMDLIIVWSYRHHWNRAIVAMLLPGAAVGLALGAMSFQWMSADVIRCAVGMLALFFVAQFIWGECSKHSKRPSGKATVLTLGALSGFASFVAHAGGPPVKGILLRQGMEKTVFVGTNTMFFFAMNATKTVAYSSMGHFTRDSMTVSLLLVPMLLIGITLGTVLHKFIAQSVFTRFVYGFLFLAGIKLLWDSSLAIWA
ncbi:sulfite exporter TauE/SafE family protein [uncultured Roseobacter sp.]|uniref:sulfite exporter TauE/SafE family protein n=1 Tax=uncultured Roseobacter sp. TaxID=114847 RepID=UPI0026159E73|nr:sulfite exporter TauE/SafE family protein [uncultured Roseobacter sp.]